MDSDEQSPGPDPATRPPRLLPRFMKGLISALQKLPLSWLAGAGRLGGRIAYTLDHRHRQLALANLTRCFGREKSEAEIRTLARENFRRIGEAYATALKTSGMSISEMGPRLEISGLENLQAPPGDEASTSRIVALGHFANFELYTQISSFLPKLRSIATYRALPHPVLNEVVQALRQRSGCEFFERRTEAGALKLAMSQPGTLLGLFADQHASGGVSSPFLGQVCYSSAAPALFALRYRCSINTAICYRTGLGRWRIEINPEIPIQNNGTRRSKEEITRDINADFEKAIRRDPANWFWVHDRWHLSRPPRVPKPPKLPKPPKIKPPKGQRKKEKKKKEPPPGPSPA